ncbi:MAG: methyltransferase protein [Geoglossum simile]|nr:MAG: methyltransferase protein [Geoglossum simile]
MDPSAQNESPAPTFYVGHHQTNRPLPVTSKVVNQALDLGYDMLTTPITTPYFHSRILTLLSSHLSQLKPGANPSMTTKSPSSSNPLPPVVPPLTPVDTPITPNETLPHLVAVVSPWIDLCSPDPLIANISKQILGMEVAYAAFCGITTVIVRGPKLHHGKANAGGLAQYARAIHGALDIGTYLNLLISMPMTEEPDSEGDEGMGSLAPFARDEYLDKMEVADGKREKDILGSWDSWNIIRTVSLVLPRHLPSPSVVSRWYAEPLRLLWFSANIFLQNAKGYPVLSKAHQALLTRYMRLRIAPWILLVDVGSIPGIQPYDPNSIAICENGSLFSPSVHADASSISPTPAEAATLPQQPSKPKYKDPTPHLSYIRHLQRNQPLGSVVERFGAGYQDYLQAPLQPLTDNLESVTYEVFEKDPIKYDWYERAIALALSEWVAQGKPASGSNGAVVIAVVGAGRGPLVTRALKAGNTSRVAVEVWAVEKNPNAFVVLNRHNEEDWDGRVRVVKSDMRSWKGPWREGVREESGDWGKVDILVSELLGSFGDNELSPECLDGVQHVLNSTHGISIPASYTAHVAPIMAPKLHADISARTPSDPSAPETPYVVMFNAIDFLASVPTNPLHPHPQTHVHQAWEFSHPLPPAVLVGAAARKGGSVGGGGIIGGDGANDHNSRFCNARFRCLKRGVCHGLAGYFEAVLYGDVELSTRPDTMERKSPNMISWFPIFFPLKTPIYFPDLCELDVSIWRQTDDRKVWYEWMIEAFLLNGDVPGSSATTRVRLGSSDLHSSKKNGCLM